MPKYENLYHSLHHELTDFDLSKYHIPKWINGSYYKNGPALFEFGNESYNHYFDGQACIHKFKFKNGTLKYTNKFVKTEKYKTNKIENKIVYPELGTAQSSFLTRLKWFFTNDIGINPNVALLKIAEKLVALTETLPWVEIDLESLDTLDNIYLDYKDLILATCHSYTTQDGTVYNVGTILGYQRYYVVFKIQKDASFDSIKDKNSKVKIEIVSKIPVKNVSYIHSFSMCSKYLVIIESPNIFNLAGVIKLKFLMLMNCIINDPVAMIYKWQPEKGTHFLVINIKTNKIVGRYKNPKNFLHFHIANTFSYQSENGNDIINIDVCSFDYINYNFGNLTSLRNNGPDNQINNRLERLKIDLFSEDTTLEHDLSQNEIIENKVTSETLYKNCEFPIINERYNFKNYNFIYMIDITAKNLIKLDIKNKTHIKWTRENVMLSEPIFIEKSNKFEDDGVVLTIGFDANDPNDNFSFLVILDAKNLVTIEIIRLPHIIPQSIHGKFYNDC